MPNNGERSKEKGVSGINSFTKVKIKVGSKYHKRI
jgi:hypothetical protein